MVRTRAGYDHFGRRCTGYQRGHDDLVDPTPAKVAIRASLLANVLDTRARDGGSRHCLNRDAYLEHMASAARAARLVDVELEQTRGRRFGATDLARCAEVVRELEAARTHTTDDLDRLLADALDTSRRVLRLARAAWRRTCEAGQHRGVPCTETNGRVQLRLTVPEERGPIDSVVGCVWHVAEYWANWSRRRGTLVFIGPTPVASDAELLGRALVDGVAEHGVTVEELNLAARTAAAARAGLGDLVASSFHCPVCRTTDTAQRAVDEGWCAGCDRHTGSWNPEDTALPA